MNKKLKIPKFNNEDEEREFWAKTDLSAYFQPEDFTQSTFPNLKPTSCAVSIRIPEYLLARLKEKAHELNVPYQTLMKQYIAMGILQTNA